MNRRLSIVFSLMAVLAILLTACGGKSNPVSRFSAITYTQVLVFKQYYADTYPLETKASAAFAEWWAYTDNGLGQLKDMKFLSDNCYSNVSKVLEEGTIGIYDTAANSDGSGNGVLNQESLISALVTNNLYPANADRCSEMLQSTLVEVVKIRQDGYEKQMNFIEVRRTLKNQYDGTLETATQRRLLNQYGWEFIEFMNAQLVTNGVEPFPADFIGFPTSGLEVSTKSKTWCGYYAGIASGETKPPTAGMSPQMYGASWIGPEQGGECLLTRQAAWEFMSRSFLSKATSNSVACGEGAPSLSETVDENCDPVQNDPNVPTNDSATPQGKAPSREVVVVAFVHNARLIAR